MGNMHLLFEKLHFPSEKALPNRHLASLKCGGPEPEAVGVREGGFLHQEGPSMLTRQTKIA